MDRETWGRLRALFDAAVEMSPEDRKALLERHREADPRLVAKIERMLEASDRPDAMIDEPLIPRPIPRARPH